MIVRMYERAADPAPGDPQFFVCFDGTNQEEILAFLNRANTGGESWIELPSLHPERMRVLYNTAAGTNTAVDFSFGDWASPFVASGRISDAGLRADFYLADDEFHL